MDWYRFIVTRNSVWTVPLWHGFYASPFSFHPPRPPTHNIGESTEVYGGSQMRVVTKKEAKMCSVNQNLCRCFCGWNDGNFWPKWPIRSRCILGVHFQQWTDTFIQATTTLHAKESRRRCDFARRLLMRLFFSFFSTTFSLPVNIWLLSFDAALASRFFSNAFLRLILHVENIDRTAMQFGSPQDCACVCV